MLQLLRTVL